MTRAEIIKSIKDKFPKEIKNFFDKSKKRIYIDIDAKDLPNLAKHIFSDLGARFNIASAVDMPKRMEILYHFTIDEMNLVISLRALLDKRDPHAPSLTPFMRGAEWIEREIHELFGIEFDGHADIKPLLLPDNWPKGKHPLRRDCKI